MRPVVIDKDLGWIAIQRAAAKADGLELRNGYLDHRQRYPKSANAKGQSISKVAMFHGLYKAVSEGYEQQRQNTDAGLMRVLKAIHAGKGHPGELIHRIIGVPIRDAMRAAVYRLVRRRSGRSAAAIRSTVFDAGKVGTRSAGYRGKVVAGDNPSQPTATQAVS